MPPEMPQVMLSDGDRKPTSVTVPGYFDASTDAAPSNSPAGPEADVEPPGEPVCGAEDVEVDGRSGDGDVDGVTGFAGVDDDEPPEEVSGAEDNGGIGRTDEDPPAEDRAVADAESGADDEFDPPSVVVTDDPPSVPRTPVPATVDAQPDTSTAHASAAAAIRPFMAYPFRGREAPVPRATRWPAPV